jgi:hypothetical protein
MSNDAVEAYYEEMADFDFVKIADEIDHIKDLVTAAWMAANYLEEPFKDPVCVLLRDIEDRLDDLGDKTIDAHRVRESAAEAGGDHAQ